MFHLTKDENCTSLGVQYFWRSLTLFTWQEALCLQLCLPNAVRSRFWQGIPTSWSSSLRLRMGKVPSQLATWSNGDWHQVWHGKMASRSPSVTTNPPTWPSSYWRDSCQKRPTSFVLCHSSWITIWWWLEEFLLKRKDRSRPCRSHPVNVLWSIIKKTLCGLVAFTWPPRSHNFRTWISNHIQRLCGM